MPSRKSTTKSSSRGKKNQEKIEQPVVEEEVPTDASTNQNQNEEPQAVEPINKESETLPGPETESVPVAENEEHKEIVQSEPSSNSDKANEHETSDQVEVNKQDKPSLDDRLFQLRLKINQGRKLNTMEAEEEYKRFQEKKRNKKKSKTAAEDEEEEDDDEDETDTKRKTEKKEAAQVNPLDAVLKHTAREAEWQAEKSKQKAEIAATYGLSAFTSDAYYRAYEKRVNKLGKQQQDKSTSSNTSLVSSTGGALQKDPNALRGLELNPFDYGKVNSDVSKAALDRLSEDIVKRDEERKKFSRRRANPEGANDIDYINEKNAHFNKKLKRAFDKYTVEIRQNLERGTAI